MRPRIRRLLKWGGIGLIALTGVAWIAGEVIMPEKHPDARFPQVLSGAANEQLAAACQDCHSDAGRIPWYGHVPYVSLLVAYDIIEGREHLDFTRWDAVSAEKRAKWLHESAEELAEGEMPPRPYALLHPEARQLNALRAALDAVAEEPAAETQPTTSGWTASAEHEDVEDEDHEDDDD